MQGRTEDKIKVEKKLQERLKGLPKYMMGYYYSLNEKTYLTKSSYITQVLRFLNFYGNGDINSIDEKALNEIDDEKIYEYIMDIQFMNGNKEIGAEAKSQIYSSINSFLSYLKKKNIICKNPFDDKGIERPKTKENDIVFLEPEEYKIVKSNIMNGVGNARAVGKQKKWMYRDLLLFQLPVITGVRVTALSQISFDDIDFRNKTIRVIDKNKSKKLFLDDETYNILLIWKENREELMEGHSDCPYLFVSNRRSKMSVRSIETIIEKYTYNINKHITPHKLRSTCGTNMYRATKDIYLVSKVLGHSSAATTKKYTQIDSTQREEASDLLAKYMKSR